MRPRIVLTATAAALLIGTLTVGGAAGEPRRWPIWHPPGPERTAESGQFSGELGESIQFNGAEYRLLPGTHIYEIGVGVLPLGTNVDNRVMTVIGVRHGGTLVARSILIRPVASPIAISTPDSRSVREIDGENRPR